MTGHSHHQHEVFDPERAAHLDTRFRQWVYRPDRLAHQYITPGSRVLDFGCGPGFFTRAYAQQVGDRGQVIAADLQSEMLSIVRAKMDAEELGPRVITHQCRPDAIGLSPDMNGTFAFASAIFVVHEVPDPVKLFREIATLLMKDGVFYFSEPPFLVSGREFREKVALAEEAGLLQTERGFYFVNRMAAFKKG